MYALIVILLVIKNTLERGLSYLLCMLAAGIILSSLYGVSTASFFWGMCILVCIYLAVCVVMTLASVCRNGRWG